MVVPKRMGDHEVNVFDTKLEEHIVHMKHQFLEVFQPFLFFLHGYKRKKRVTNMLVFMLDSRFKNLWLLTNYIGHEKTSTLVV